jgi:nucleoside-diphosphate-sugar epimerase
MRIFVTGASGFIGGHLAETLSARHEVLALARTIHDFLTALASTQHVSLVNRRVPSSVARPAARLIEGAWRLLGIAKAPPMTRFAIDMMSSTVTVSTAKARADLGYAPVISVEEGLRKMAEAARADAHR